MDAATVLMTQSGEFFSVAELLRGTPNLSPTPGGMKLRDFWGGMNWANRADFARKTTGGADDEANPFGDDGAAEEPLAGPGSVPVKQLLMRMNWRNAKPTAGSSGKSARPVEENTVDNWAGRFVWD